MSRSAGETLLHKGFTEFNSGLKLFESGQRILLAVSGGIDSVALFNLFLNEPVELGVVHCNFKLRGSDSDEDEAFVRNLCSLRKIPFYVRHFNTEEFSKEKKISIQLAARELRYLYFEEVRAHEKYDQVAVAHNSDDTIETFFINLIRGTGIKGLTGIKAKSGKVIRPLLFASREQIENFASEINMLHRLDKSNLSNKYKRNQIRNELLPLLDKLAPSFRNTMLEVLNNLQAVSKVYSSHLQHITNELFREIDDDIIIDIDLLTKQAFYQEIFPDLLRQYGFTRDISANILRGLHAESGRFFLSPSHRLLKNRSRLIITNRNSEPEELFYIDEETNAIELPILLKIKTEKYTNDFKISSDPKIACIDRDKLVFPLILRHWKFGDHFKPLGMTQMKKLSDYFINEKFSVLDKERAWLLVSDGKIIWICGHRLDERFKITESTSKIIQIEILD